MEQIKDEETWKISERKMELIFKENGEMIQSISGKVVKYVYKIIGDNVIIDNISGVFKDGMDVSKPKYATRVLQIRRSTPCGYLAANSYTIDTPYSELNEESIEENLANSRYSIEVMRARGKDKTQCYSSMKDFSIYYLQKGKWQNETKTRTYSFKKENEDGHYFYSCNDGLPITFDNNLLNTHAAHYFPIILGKDQLLLLNIYSKYECHDLDENVEYKNLSYKELEEMHSKYSNITGFFSEGEAVVFLKRIQ